MSGRSWLVGAGPGDPDLITVRGRRLLGWADAVVYDRLVDPRLVDLARPDAFRIPVGKAGYGPAVAQDEIHEILLGLARAGLCVVRLKGGDPFVFGRGGEEVAALREAGIPVEVVPGVTAGVAGPASVGIPVTHRGLAHGVVFVPGGPGADGGAVDWAAVAGIDTVVVYMAGRTAASIATRLLDAGRAPSTPAAVIRDASGPNQEHELTTLRGLADEPPEVAAGDDRPVLLVIGAVAALADDVPAFARGLVAIGGRA
jgi:uroporphyrin-III C-methyltransferase